MCNRSVGIVQTSKARVYCDYLTLQRLSYRFKWYHAYQQSMIGLMRWKHRHSLCIMCYQHPFADAVGFQSILVLPMTSIIGTHVSNEVGNPVAFEIVHVFGQHRANMQYDKQEL
jgi:hypothetical protein